MKINPKDQCRDDNQFASSALVNYPPHVSRNLFCAERQEPVSRPQKTKGFSISEWIQPSAQTAKTQAVAKARESNIALTTNKALVCYRAGDTSGGREAITKLVNLSNEYGMNVLQVLFPDQRFAPPLLSAIVGAGDHLALRQLADHMPRRGARRVDWGISTHPGKVMVVSTADRSLISFANGKYAILEIGGVLPFVSNEGKQCEGVIRSLSLTLSGLEARVSYNGTSTRLNWNPCSGDAEEQLPETCSIM